jgi:hypothetical protein
MLGFFSSVLIARDLVISRIYKIVSAAVYSSLLCLSDCVSLYQNWYSNTTWYFPRFFFQNSGRWVFFAAARGFYTCIYEIGTSDLGVLCGGRLRFLYEN